MTPSIASELLAHLTTTSIFAADSLEEWSWLLFTALTCLGVIIAYTKHAISGNPLDFAFFGALTIKGVLVGFVIFAYFILSMDWMELTREAGMRLSGSTAETVDVGEMARQADDVAQVINDTIDALKAGGLLATIGFLPEITSLMILNAVVHILFAVIALIAVWVFSKFILGYIVGGVFIAGVAWDQTYQYGKSYISYVLVSAMPLFLLAFLQGFSATLLEGVTLRPGAPATVPEIWRMIEMQGYIVMLSLAAAIVPREWLSSVVGSGGALSGQAAARNIASGGGGIAGGLSSVSNALKGLGGGGGGGAPSLPGPSGGGPQSVGNAPSLNGR